MGKAKTDKPLKYDANHIIGVHGLARRLDCEILAKLENTSGEIEYEFLSYLEVHRQSLRVKGDYWNEEELKMNFLAHVFYVAQLEEPNKIDIFYERTLSWEFNDKIEKVVCDCLLAKPFGIYAPQKPYFFLQEFKKQKQNEDAEGQMLLAMLMAQKENDNNKPIYGCYLQGKFWVFSTLFGKNYCVTKAYDATQKDDLYQIIFILRALKQVILTELI
jgi:hypothetical protein